MTDRQAFILKIIVEHYITHVEPVGSRFLVEEKGLDASGATARNEMRDLEQKGFLTHPHTSAGRIPTELGYQYYIEHLMEEAFLEERRFQNLSGQLCHMRRWDQESHFEDQLSK